MASNSRKKMKISDLIGESPAKKREKEREKKKRIEMNDEELRKIALEKGLNPNF